MSAEQYKPKNPFAKTAKIGGGEERPKKKIRTFTNPFENRDLYGSADTGGFRTSDIINGRYEDEITPDLSIPYFGQETDQPDAPEQADHKPSRNIFKKAAKKEPAFDYSRSGVNYKPEILNNPMADLALTTGKK